MSEDWGDTSDRAQQVRIAALRAMAPGERLAAALNFSESLVRFMEAGERKASPEASDREIFLRVLVRRIGPELVKKAYGWP